MNANHEIFLKHLNASEGARWQVARWLLDRGYSIQIDPMTLAPTQDEWQEHADSGDLHVAMRVEVKQLSCDFTCRNDWPHGGNFIVCARNAHDRAKPKPYAYVILNRAGTHAAFVLSSSSPTWKTGRRMDSRYQGVEQDFYFAPLDSVVFSPLKPQEIPHDLPHVQTANSR